MTHPTLPTERPQRIDLMSQADMQFWCIVFGVTLEQLREAVQKAGNEPDEVEHYLRQQGTLGKA